jgi:uncharacterized damage-inducible protein DinB
MRCALVAMATLTLAGSVGAQTPAGFRGEFLDNYKELETKFGQLAAAIPREKYDWRPGQGVRSTCEVFMHIVVDNYLLGGAVGLTMSEAMKGPNAEKCPADKGAAVTAMRQSFAAFRAGVTAMKETELDAKFSLFGTERTKRAWLLATAEHAGEHLGQLIAYARMNGVVPPWSK